MMEARAAIARLQPLVDHYTNSAPGLIDAIRFQREPARVHGFCASLASYHRIMAMQAKYSAGDDQGFRQHMYVACKLEIKSIQLEDLDPTRQNGIDASMSTAAQLWFALLSDSPEVVSVMAYLEPAYYARHRHDPLNPQFLVHMWQLAIQGDYETLEAKVDKMAKNGRKPLRTLCAERKDFFSLLMRADKAGLEARITEDAKLRNDDPITQDFFTYLATFEAKLCWHKGIEVQIDHPRVPMDLMPVKPLAHYDDVYDFLKPGWVPPPQGLIGKLSRWLKR